MVIFKQILLSMLTVHMIPVPPQLRIVLLSKQNLVKEIRCGSVCGQGGTQVRALGDHIRKDINESLGVLDATEENQQDFQPSLINKVRDLSEVNGPYTQ